MKSKIILTILLMCSASVFSTVTITESTEKALSFIFTADSFSISTYTAGDSTYSLIKAGNTNAAILDPNGIKTPGVSVCAGVPQEGMPEVSFVALESKRIVLANPIAFEREGLPSLRQEKIRFDNPWVSPMAVIHFRDLRTGNILIRPFVYDPQTQTMMVLLKGSCSITFPPATKSRRTLLRTDKGDYYGMLKSLIVNFDVAKYWAEPESFAPASRSVQTYLSTKNTMLSFKIGDGHEEFNETTTNENGMVKIRAQDVLSFFGRRRIPISSVALFGSIKKELDSIVPAYAAIPSGVLQIPLLRMDCNANGLFDGDDYLLAYCTGLCDWNYDTASHNYSYSFNHYEDLRTYWLCDTTGVSVKPYSCSGTGVETLKFFENRVRFKKSLDLMSEISSKPHGGKEWIWSQLNSSNQSLILNFNNPDVVKDYGGFVRVVPGSTYGGGIKVSFGDSLLTFTNEWFTFSRENWLKPTLNLAFDGTSGIYEVKDIDFRYSSRISMSMNKKKQLRIYSPVYPNSTTRIVTYQLDSIPKVKTYIVRLSSDESVVSLVDTVKTGGAYSWTDTAGRGIQYIVCTDSGLNTVGVFDRYTPQRSSAYELTELRSNATGVDYLIITHPDFLDAAADLARHKQISGKFKNPRVVTTETVFREFSGGIRDIGAVRNFIEDLMYKAQTGGLLTPDYVVLMGTGHYDYKGYGSHNYVNYVPPCEMEFKCFEDFFGIVRPGEIPIDGKVAPSVFVGRIPCLTLSEAKATVAKIIEMESSEGDYGPWRNRVLLVSDDDMQGKNQDPISHFESSETIEQNVRNKRPSVEIRKVYEFEYEKNELFQKPEASNALFNEVNNGVSIVNFFGHGSANAWTDEYILSRDKMNNFHNNKRYPLLNSFSCSVAFFDSPGGTCLNGLMVTMPDAGAIASIGSSRTAYATQNTDMAITYFNEFLKPGTSRSIGQAYALTKAQGWGSNLKHYVFLGDPSIRFLSQPDSIQVTLVAEDGSPVDPLKLKAMQKYLIRGTIYKDGVQKNAFTTTAGDSALIQVAFFNPDQDSVHRKDGLTFSDPVYRLPGTPIFLGTVPVYNGEFSQKVFIPRKVTFGKAGAMILAYAWQKNRQCAVGVLRGMKFDGSNINSQTNKEGPILSVSIVKDSGQWTGGGLITDKISSTLPLILEINAWDENGIDLTGIGPDEGLTVEIPGVLPRRNLNSKFIFASGEFSKGKATFGLKQGDIKIGKYDFSIQAQDLLGNGSRQVVSLEILGENVFKINQVFNYPNPVHIGSSTKFCFGFSTFSVQEVTIRIYTLSGKLLRVFANVKQNSVPWDLTDQRGNFLPPNVYLYRVFMKKAEDGFSSRKDFEKSAIKKLVILPPH
jgi:hypothetical protein